MQKAYAAALQPRFGTDPEALSAACNRCLQECKFFPAPAEIIQRAPTPQDRTKLYGETEWNAICAHVRRFGAVVYPSDKPLALSGAGEHAFRQIGWRAGLLDVLASEDPDRLHWIKKNFLDAFAYHQETDGLTALPRGEAAALLERTKARIEAARPKLPAGKGA